jgi:hypothetical protein
VFVHSFHFAALKMMIILCIIQRETTTTGAFSGLLVNSYNANQTTPPIHHSVGPKLTYAEVWKIIDFANEIVWIQQMELERDQPYDRLH